MNIEALELHRKDAEDPRWEGQRDFTWRWFVPEEVRNIWDDLPIEARMAIVAVAEKGWDSAVERNL